MQSAMRKEKKERDTFTTQNRVIITITLEEKEFFKEHVETSPRLLMKWAIRKYREEHSKNKEVEKDEW